MKLTEQERMQEKFTVSKVSKDYYEVTFNGKAKNGILFQVVLEKSDMRHLIQKLDNAI